MGAQPKMETTARIPAEINTKLRALAHDLSNSIETIMQASYLLAQMKLDENAKRWADLIRPGVIQLVSTAKSGTYFGPVRNIFTAEPQPKTLSLMTQMTLIHTDPLQ